MLRKKLILLTGILFIIPIGMLLLSLAGKNTNNDIKQPPAPGATKTSQVTITNIYPKNNETVPQTGSIIITFEELPSETISFSFEPHVDGIFIRDNVKKQFSFVPSTGFTTNTIYEATITMRTPFTIPLSTQKTTSYTWSFKTGEQEGEVGFTEADASEFIEQRSIAEQTYAERKKRLPFIEYVPYTTNHYKVEIMSTSDTVTITTFGTTQTQITQYQNEAKAWLKANGGNVETLDIQYRNETQ